MSDVGRVLLAARVFTIATLAALAGVAGHAYLRGALQVVVVGFVALVVATWTPLGQQWVALAEGGVVALLTVMAFPAQDPLASYLVVPALVAAVDAGGLALARVLLLESAVLVVAWALLHQAVDRAAVTGGMTWLAAAAGVGLIGTLLRRTSTLSGSDGTYRSAVALIRRLDALSERLSSGLDAVGIAERVMEDADLEQHTLAAAVFVGTRSGEISALRYAAGAQPGSMAWAQDLAERAWQHRGHLVEGTHVALPLAAGDEVVAIVTLETATRLDARAVTTLQRHLSGHALQLQAALLFGRVREAATSEERQRIAREVHDGVAQDVASLGYLVDNLGGVLTDPEQLHRVGQLREQVTRVVGDLRRSIFDLRQETVPGAGLGESLSTYANRVAATSPMAMHVTLDEEGPRLAADVEFELMRIAQEAMANARKHSQASNLWLRCTVRAPYAEIEVRDDGTLPHAPGGDSHGLTIMRERAASIGGQLVVEGPEPGRPGTRVHVSVGRDAAYAASQHDLQELAPTEGRR